MCGIGCLLRSRCKCGDCAAAGVLLPPLLNRGPDAQSSVTLPIGGPIAGSSGLDLTVGATVLHMRGSVLHSQPVVTSDGSVFAWNGELFGGAVAVADSSSDTEALHAAICSAVSAGGAAAVTSLLSRVHGPWSVLYFHGPSQTLFFGRDPVGRRSLLLRLPGAVEADGACDSSAFWLSSVALPFIPACCASAAGAAGSAGDAAASRAAEAGAMARLGLDPSVQELEPRGVYALSLASMSCTTGGDRTTAAGGAGDCVATSAAVGSIDAPGDSALEGGDIGEVIWTGPASTPFAGCVLRCIPWTADALPTMPRQPGCLPADPPATDSAAAGARVAAAEAAAVAAPAVSPAATAAGDAAHPAASTDSVLSSDIASDAEAASAAAALLAALSAAVQVRVQNVPPPPLPPSGCGLASPSATAVSRGRDPAPAAPSLDGAAAAHEDCSRSSSSKGGSGVDHLVFLPGSEPIASSALRAAAAAGVALPANGAAYLRSVCERAVAAESSPCSSPAAIFQPVAAAATSSTAARIAVLFSGGLDSMVLAALAHAHVPIEQPIDLINVCFAPDHRSPDRQGAVAGLCELQRACPGRRWQLICADESIASAYEAQLNTARLLAPRLSHMDFSIASALWFAARGVGYADVEVDVDAEKVAAGDILDGAVLGGESAGVHITGGAAASAGSDAAHVPAADDKLSPATLLGRAIAASVHPSLPPGWSLGADGHAFGGGELRYGGVGGKGASLTDFDVNEGKGKGRTKGKGKQQQQQKKKGKHGKAAAGDCATADDAPAGRAVGEEAIKIDADVAAATVVGGAGASAEAASASASASVSASAEAKVADGSSTATVSAASAAPPASPHQAVARLLSPADVQWALYGPRHDDSAGKTSAALPAAGCGFSAASSSTPDRDVDDLHAAAAASLVSLYRRAIASTAGGAGSSVAAASSSSSAADAAVAASAACSLGTSVADASSSRSTQRHRLRVLVRSSARVLLSGLGADEQLGGYARHRGTIRFGWARLGGELDVDTRRLWQRNLGRDDRVISDHGRELRLPFLDERVSALIRCTPLQHLLDLRLPYGVGDKRALRIAAHALGLPAVALLVKRAIHFGSRIAKQSNVRAFGSNSKGSGDAAFVFDFASAAAGDGEEAQ